jgi:hypothetical protein
MFVKKVFDLLFKEFSLKHIFNLEGFRFLDFSQDVVELFSLKYGIWLYDS